MASGMLEKGRRLSTYVDVYLLLSLKGLCYALLHTSFLFYSLNKKQAKTSCHREQIGMKLKNQCQMSKSNKARLIPYRKSFCRHKHYSTTSAPDPAKHSQGQSQCHQPPLSFSAVCLIITETQRVD